MDSETLERLLLDRGLGALPPDCEALLDAYLEAHPDAASASRQIDQVVKLTQQAFAKDASTALPAFPVEQLRQVEKTARTWQLARTASGIAASILIGFAAHAFLLRPAEPTADHPAPVVIARADLPRTRTVVSTDTDFWSGRRLSGQASTTPRQPVKRLTWDSPVRIPRIRGAS